MSYKQLTENERYQIYTLLKVGFSLKAIADELNRHSVNDKPRAKAQQRIKGLPAKTGAALGRNTA